MVLTFRPTHSILGAGFSDQHFIDQIKDSTGVFSMGSFTQFRSLQWLLWAALLATVACSPSADTPTEGQASVVSKPALTVDLVQVQQQTLPATLSANGNVAAWQEAVISSQLNGVRIDSLKAQVGDVVKKGQVLAQFDSETVRADLLQAKAAVAEAQALYDQASLNANMVRQINDPGAISAQELNQITAAEKSAQARLQSAKAMETQQNIRLRNTTVTALDDGVISARNATVGAVPSPGQDLFRLVRQNRLEWRAELNANELASVQVGHKARVFLNDQAIEGTVRAVSPVVNMESRNALVYVDIPQAYSQGLKAGMYLRGEFELGSTEVLSIPQTALIERDGFTYAFTYDAGKQQVQRVKIQVDRSRGDVVVVQSGLKAGEQVVKSGVAFLADGDSVKVVQ